MSAREAGRAPAPLIGITTYGRDDQNKFSLFAQYVESVRRSGALPVLLPHGETRAAEILSKLDGLMLSGGGDVDPSHYGGAAHDEIYMVDAERDAMEFELTRLAIERRVPLLGICRGMQVMNVALGGTLIEHLEDEVGGRVAHREPPRLPTNHPIRVTAGSHLAEVMGRTDFSAASWHHQGIRATATALRTVAYAPDGSIEAVEMSCEDHPWLIGVQWHPELTAADDPIQQRLFDAFADAARSSNGGLSS